MTDALLPCPFCEAFPVQHSAGPFIACEGEGCPMFMRLTHHDDWNRRPPSPKLELPQEVLEMMERVESSDRHYATRAEKVLAAFIRRIAGEGERG